MKKVLFLVVVMMVSLNVIQAQDFERFRGESLEKVYLSSGKVKYQGELDLGYSLGVGTFATDRVNIHTIHGAKIGKYFSAGVGVGLDLYTEGEGTDIIVPIYLNMKGFLPTGTVATPYFSMDIGAGVGASEYTSGLSGMVITPAIGVNYGLLKVQIGYNVQKISEMGISININSIQLKIGIML